MSGTEDAVALSVGLRAGCIVTLAGQVRCWGRKLEDPGSELYVPECDTEAVTVPLDDVVAVGRVDTHACAVTGEGRVWCWGFNSFGQVGLPPEVGRWIETPVEVDGLEDARAITAGEYHNCALTEAGEVWCWGSNSHRALGPDATNHSHVPLLVLPR